MSEDPTIAYSVTPTDQGAPREVPTATAVWGSFTLLARVGAGGFGEVYRAWDPHLQREVALKLLLPGSVTGEVEYEAMLREARSLASVRHPNIVPVHGIDRHNGRVGFWTDFVRGKTLNALLGEQGTFGEREAALIGLDVARALSAVHRAGLLHRDIKAENVMREEGGRILLMDFGLSALEQGQTNIAGTPNYMAPELFNGEKGTVAADIYSMGVLLYFLVSGDFPVRLTGQTWPRGTEPFPARRPLIDIRPDLSESLLRTVATATEMDPAKRFTSAGQLANALAESLGTPAAVELSPAPEPLPRLRKSRISLWITGALAAAVVIGYMAWPGNLQRVLHRASRSNAADPATAGDEFLKAQNMLLHSYKESNVAEAMKGFKAVLQKDPNNALAESLLGDAYFVQHGYTSDPKLLDMARDSANRAMALEPELAAPHVTLARIAAMEGQTQLATQEVQKSLQLEPRSPAAHGALGEVYGAQGREKDAIAEFQQAVNLAPEDWRWPMSLGVAEYRQGNFDGAIAQFQKGAELAPDNAVAFYDLSIAHRKMGRLQEARADLEHSIQLEPTARRYAALGSQFLLEGRYDEAIKTELKAIALDPNYYTAYGDLAAAYDWSGTDHEKMVQATRKAIDLMEIDRAKSPQDAELLAQLAGHYQTVGDSNKCLVLTRQALALSPDDPIVQYTAGETLEEMGQRQAAIPLIANAVAKGYNTYELERNPQLASLRSDPKFKAMLNQLKQRDGTGHHPL
jgi:serine/threonine protein kinase/predicted Zn-dependent protease